jgi:hypothetical protein
MAKFRKRPVVVEAVQWTGDNLDEIKAFGGADIVVDSEHPIIVKTANGLVALGRHAWLVRDPTSGDTWPMASNIFERTYESVEG